MINYHTRRFSAATSFLVVFCIIASVALCGEDSRYKISSRIIPKDFNGAYEFLEYIKYPNEPKGAFDAQAAPVWDLSKFLSFISVHGVEFSDVNGGLSGHRSTDQIKESLSNRKDEVFAVFAHLADIYSVPYKQYSELTFERDGTYFVVHVADWYKLTFVSEGGRLRLSKCDYLQLESD